MTERLGARLQSEIMRSRNPPAIPQTMEDEPDKRAGTALKADRLRNGFGRDTYFFLQNSPNVYGVFNTP